MVVYSRTNKIQIICPICKTRDIIGIPVIRQNEKIRLTTISIHKGLICPHHFQIFVDKNLQIRGYQKVDLELHQENSKKLRNGVKAFNENKNENNHFFAKLILEGNTVKFKPLTSDIINESREIMQKIVPKSKKVVLKEIYEEFWEFIDRENKDFSEFITNDKRRRRAFVNSNFNEKNNRIELEQEI
jgi:tRNA U34 5-carboxymethylaminomethyl modifying enzyme MnmG/GidA